MALPILPKLIIEKGNYPTFIEFVKIGGACYKRKLNKENKLNPRIKNLKLKAPKITRSRCVYG